VGLIVIKDFSKEKGKKESSSSGYTRPISKSRPKPETECIEVFI
jgi:hypothetical protein